MECVGYTISDRAGRYRPVVEFVEYEDAHAACDHEGGDEIGWVWADGSVTFDGIPPEPQRG